MVTIKLDGQEFPSTGVRTMSELVEFVKSSIDPDTIITSMAMNGRNLTEADWRVPLSVQGDSTLEISTGGKEKYIADRLEASSLFLEHIINEFSHARACFQEAASADGNAAIATATSDLKAFIDWYGSLLSMEESLISRKQAFVAQIETILKTCEQLCQQQLYQSWWAIGETLQSKLEPQLTDLKTSCAAPAA